MNVFQLSLVENVNLRVCVDMRLTCVCFWYVCVFGMCVFFECLYVTQPILLRRVFFPWLCRLLTGATMLCKFQQAYKPGSFK
jgi:hypothetical protein